MCAAFGPLTPVNVNCQQTLPAAASSVTAALPVAFGSPFGTSFLPASVAFSWTVPLPVPTAAEERRHAAGNTGLADVNVCEERRARQAAPAQTKRDRLARIVDRDDRLPEPARHERRRLLEAGQRNDAAVGLRTAERQVSTNR